MSEQLHLEIAAGEGLYLTQAARRFPSYRNNRPVSLSCLVRWVLNGARTPDGGRVRLEAARLAGKWITTPGAIARFLAAQTPYRCADDQTADTAPPPRSPTKRVRANSRVDEALDKIGV